MNTYSCITYNKKKDNNLLYTSINTKYIIIYILNFN